MKSILTITCLIILVSCNCGNKSPQNAKVEQKDSLTTEMTEITKMKNRRDSITRSLDWKELKCGLFLNKNGDLGFEDYRALGREGLMTETYYITNFGLNDGSTLKNTIDTATFRELNDVYYKDKKYIYHFYAMAYGGMLNIFEEADYDSFEVLSDCYAKDKNHIYERRNGRLENIDAKTFKTVDGPGCVAKDKNGYYSWGSKIEKDEVNDRYVRESIQKLDK